MNIEKKNKISLSCSLFIILILISWLADFPEKMGYSDQFLYLDTSKYAVDRNILFQDIRHRNIALNHPWIMVQSAILYIFHSPAFILIFNAFSWIGASIYTVRQLSKRKYYRIHNSLLPYFMLFPPALFAAGLYFKESTLQSILLLNFVAVFFLQRRLAFISYILLLVQRPPIALGAFFLQLPLFFESLSSKAKSIKKRHYIIISILFFAVLVFLLSRYGDVIELGKFDSYISQIRGDITTNKLSESSARRYEYIGTGVNSLKSLIYLIVFSVFDTHFFRFLSYPSFRTFFESFMVTGIWILLIPVFIKRLIVCDFHERIAYISTFGLVFFLTTLSILTSAPEVFRYRLCSYPILLISLILSRIDPKPKIDFLDKILPYAWYSLNIVWLFVYI